MCSPLRDLQDTASPLPRGDDDGRRKIAASPRSSSPAPRSAGGRPSTPPPRHRRAVAAAAAAAARGLCADHAVRVVLVEPLVRLGRAARAPAGGIESVQRAVVGGAVCAAAVVVLLGALDGDGLLVDVPVDAARRAWRPRGGDSLRSASDGGGGGDDGGRWRWSA